MCRKCTGILHRNLSIEAQAKQADLVKRSESGMITDPVTVGPDATLAELDALCGQYRVSGLPVIDADRRLVGPGTGGRLLQQHQILPLGITVHPFTPVFALALVEIPHRHPEFTGQRRGRQRYQRRTLAVESRHNPLSCDQMV